MRKTKMTFCRYVSVLFCVTCQIDDMDQMKVEISARQGGNFETGGLNGLLTEDTLRLFRLLYKQSSCELMLYAKDRFAHSLALTPTLDCSFTLHHYIVRVAVL